ncbi:MAG: formate dehydrogenase accessory sulfurtransferase FdhD [Candidatus Margulisiibacteriota bacterium]
MEERWSSGSFIGSFTLNPKQSKCLKVPLIVSRSAPTNMAVKLAKQLNISLVGFARGNRLNSYA